MAAQPGAQPHPPDRLDPDGIPQRAREDFYALVDKHYLALSEPKRAQGHGDCSAELDEATRLAAAEIAARYAKAPKVTASHVTRTQPARSRERRSRTSRSRRASGSSGDDSDSDGPEPASRRHLTVHIAGSPSVESDAAVARFLERFLAAERPGTTWTATGRPS